MPKTRVDISKLKDFAVEKLQKDSPLREVLITENQQLDVSTFLALLPTWLKLLRMERGRHGFSEE